MRDTIFIGHANPEDNDFTIWLYSRITNEGYKAWCDLKDLYGGERDFWEEIEKIIRYRACKYVFAFSKSSFKKDGIKDEFEFARSIARNNNLEDFVIPLRIENVSYDTRIGINRYNVIDFSDSWGEGLRKLLKKLEKDDIQKNPEGPINLSDLLLNTHSKNKIEVIQKKERYYSNWWQIRSLPPRMHLFQFATEFVAQSILEESEKYPIVRHGNYLASFEFHIEKILKKNNHMEINPITTKTVTVSKILEGYESNQFPTLVDSQNLLKRLLKKAFKNLMYDRGLRKKDLSFNQCFYYPKNTLYKNKALIKYHNREKYKQLVGRHFDKFWHYGVSTQVKFYPLVCYSLKSHVLFSDDGYSIWLDESKLHSARRSKCKRWFNEYWRDLLMAFISSLAKGKNKIELRLAINFYLKMPLFTQRFFSSIGYNEPKTSERLNKLYESEENIYEITDISQEYEEQPDEANEVSDD